MTILAPEETQIDPTSGPTPFRWTRAEYEELAEKGWFEGRRVELIDGEILEMAAQKGPHVVSVELTGDALKAAFGPGHFIRRQAPLHLPDGSAPEPDVAVVLGDPRTHLVNPDTALLVVEVSDATLAYDLGRKARLYARNGILEYWVVDLIGRRVVVHRSPDADTGDWGERQSVSADGTVIPGSRPELTVRVADLLP